MILTDFSKIKFGSADITAVSAGAVKLWPAETVKTVVSFTLTSGDTWNNPYISAYAAGGRTIEPVEKTATGWTYGEPVEYFKINMTEKMEQNLSTFNGVEGGMTFKSQSKLFNWAREMTTVNCSNINPTGEDYSEMFNGCNKLTSLDLTTWDMSNATTTANMFINCYAMADLKMGDTFGKMGQISNMEGMFANCKALTSLDLSGMTVASCTNMNNLFLNCESLSALSLSGWEVQSAKNSAGVFAGCKALKTVDMTNSTQESIAIVRSWLNSAGLSSVVIKGLTELDKRTLRFAIVSGDTWNNTAVSAYTADDRLIEPTEKTATGWTYAEDVAYIKTTTNHDEKNLLTYIGIDAKYKDCTDFFYSSPECASINTVGMDVSECTDMRHMFGNCGGLTSLNLTNWDTSNVRTMTLMFAQCNNLVDIDLSNWNVSNVSNMHGMFDMGIKAGQLTRLNLSNWELKENVDTGIMFNMCKNLSKVIMKNCSSATVEKIKAALTASNITGAEIIQ
jgi:surface protein